MQVKNYNLNLKHSATEHFTDNVEKTIYYVTSTEQSPEQSSTVLHPK